jgi:hypothetical protein
MTPLAIRSQGPLMTVVLLMAGYARHLDILESGRLMALVASQDRVLSY